MSNVATLGVGATDIFISQQPYGSWGISTTAAVWEPPSNPGAAPGLTMLSGRSRFILRLERK